MTNWIEFIKAVIRPFIIVWSCVIYGICVIKGIEVPEVLSGLIAVMVVEYFSERAVKRFKEK